jgi:hypothetical protein
MAEKMNEEISNKYVKGPSTPPSFWEKITDVMS